MQEISAPVSRRPSIHFPLTLMVRRGCEAGDMGTDQWMPTGGAGAGRLEPLGGGAEACPAARLKAVSEHGNREPNDTLFHSAGRGWRAAGRQEQGAVVAP